MDERCWALEPYTCEGDAASWMSLAYTHTRWRDRALVYQCIERTIELYRVESIYI